MSINLIFSDIDGTLIKPNGEMTEVTMKTVHKVNAMGIPFVLVSARSPEEMFDYYNDLNLNTPIIGYNGGVIAEYKNNKLNIISSLPIHADEPFIIYNSIKEMFPQISLSIYSGTKWYADEIDYGIEIEKKLTGKDPIVTNLREFILNGACIHKIMMIGEHHDVVNADKYLKNQNILTSSIHRSGEIYLEVTNSNATKINAIKSIVENYYDVNQKNIMAIGDGYNDWEMLKFAKYGIAMGNAPIDIINSLNYVTKSNLNDGVAHIINELVLNCK